MARKSLSLYAALALVVALSILHSTALTHHLYFVYWWYDVMMHFLAGLALGSFVYWILFASKYVFTSTKSRTSILLWVIMIVLAIGLAWEVFEYVNDIAGPSFEGYKLDTMNDLILDVCGAALAALIVTSRRRHGSTKLTANG